MKLRNVSPRGDLEVPLIRRVVAYHEVFEVNDDQADRLLDQSDNFAPSDEEAKLLADKKAAALAQAEEAAKPVAVTKAHLKEVEDAENARRAAAAAAEPQPVAPAVEPVEAAAAAVETESKTTGKAAAK